MTREEKVAKLKQVAKKDPALWRCIAERTKDVDLKLMSFEELKEFLNKIKKDFKNETNTNTPPPASV